MSITNHTWEFISMPFGKSNGVPLKLFKSCQIKQNGRTNNEESKVESVEYCMMLKFLKLQVNQ
jgi:hypothetical protein